ncbi:hypothetical protein JIN85_01485 [Luteolibacter pohnpeiensis]|uniref:Uncharacterized protein n=1 Tax=Luteolibacter pohnpeiensis TaxID=454153 RepID=A0A934S0M2_9BACT|nr:hypothetical protein [Luteolibacter pohnpeiensis]MBK1881065.1 hypothetical protein [Luteolibacter pohnpeiensis]
MSTNAKKAGVRGKRYTPAEKQNIVSFVEEYNATNGRGGQSAASKKFGISQLTISSWLKSSGEAAPAAAAAPAKRGRKAGKAAATTKGSMNAKLSELLSIGNEIEKTEKSLEALKAKFNSIKASL